MAAETGSIISSIPWHYAGFGLARFAQKRNLAGQRLVNKTETRKKLFKIPIPEQLFVRSISTPQEIMESDDEASWSQVVLTQFELAGIDGEKVEEWLTEDFAPLRDHEEDLYALCIYLGMKLDSLPDTIADEEDLLIQHFCFRPEAAQRIVEAVQQMGDHTNLLDEVSVLLLNAQYLTATRCSTTPFQWVDIRNVTNEVHRKTSTDLCVYNAPRSMAESEEELQTAIADLINEAEDEGYALLYHGTSWSDALQIVRDLALMDNRPTDFVPRHEGGFYLGNDWYAAREWAKKRAKAKRQDPAVVIFRVEPMKELISREDNLSLDLRESGQEDAWDKMVKGCRLNIPEDYSEIWSNITYNKSSITGPMGKNRGTSKKHYVRDGSTWQMAVISKNRLRELMSQMYGIIVWGQNPQEVPANQKETKIQHASYLPSQSVPPQQRTEQITQINAAPVREVPEVEVNVAKLTIKPGTVNLPSVTIVPSTFTVPSFGRIQPQDNGPIINLPDNGQVFESATRTEPNAVQTTIAPYQGYGAYPVFTQQRVYQQGDNNQLISQLYPYYRPGPYYIGPYLSTNYSGAPPQQHSGLGIESQNLYSSVSQVYPQHTAQPSFNGLNTTGQGAQQCYGYRAEPEFPYPGYYPLFVQPPTAPQQSPYHQRINYQQ